MPRPRSGGFVFQRFTNEIKPGSGIAEIFGGSSLGNDGPIVSAAIRCHDLDQSICLTLPPLSTVVLELTEPPEPVDAGTVDPTETGGERENDSP